MNNPLTFNVKTHTESPQVLIYHTHTSEAYIDEDVDYKTLFFREAICRILVRTVSLGISSVISYVVMFIRDDNKSIADIFAKTKVIDIKEEL